MGNENIKQVVEPQQLSQEEKFLEKYRSLKKWIQNLLGIELTPIEAVHLRNIMERVLKSSTVQKKENVNAHNIILNTDTEIAAIFFQECYGISIDEFAKLKKTYSREESKTWFRKIQGEDEL